MNNPEVNFEAPEKSLWTLMLTNPDGHLNQENSEYIHWLVYVFLLFNRLVYQITTFILNTFL